MSHPTGETTFRLLLKVCAFTLLVPGTVVVLVPYLLVDDLSWNAIDPFGPALLGVFPVLLGIALYFRCALDFAFNGRGTPAPTDPPVVLVASGPYRYTRNPMYIGILAIIAGELLIYADRALLYYLLLLAAVFHTFVVAYEERVLRRQFGASYQRYRDEVPRWIPKPAGLRALYRMSFLKVGALVLGAGALAHILRLTVELPVAEMPESIHTILVLLPAYAAVGCIVYARHIELPGIGHKIIFALATGLLATTALMHAWSIAVHDSQWLGIFPRWYSVVAMLVYGTFAHFMKTRRWAPEPTATN